MTYLYAVIIGLALGVLLIVTMNLLAWYTMGMTWRDVWQWIVGEIGRTINWIITRIVGP